MQFLTRRRSAAQMTTTPGCSASAWRYSRLALWIPAGLAGVTSAMAIAQKRGKGNARASGGVDGFYTETNAPEL